MLLRALLLTICFVIAAPAQRTPKITLNKLHVSDGDSLDMLGVGFTPNRSVLSHLRKPDHTEYPVLQFTTSDRGEFSHTIDTLLLLPGTHELWVVDELSKATSNRLQFTVGFGGASPATEQVRDVVSSFAGVWRGTASRNVPPVSTNILLAITGQTGAIAGIIAYPELSCGGTVGFKTVYSDSIEMSETITYGAERCVSGGEAVIKLSRDGGMSFQWRHPKASEVPAGKLNSMKE